MTVRTPDPTPVRTGLGLLAPAALFMVLGAIALSVVPAVRVSGSAPMNWAPLGLAVLWLAVALAGVGVLGRRLPGHDPVLFPLAMTLAGFGLLSIWRVLPEWGWRQAAWLVVAVVIGVLTAAWAPGLRWARRLRYTWLVSGLVLTALTFVIGVDPSGTGARLWLGSLGIGVFLQPAEFLKLALALYVAAYLAERREVALLNDTEGKTAPWPRLQDALPVLVMWLIAMAIVIAQRDLGTGMLLFGVFVALVYLATGRARNLVLGGILAVFGGLVAYSAFGVVRARLSAWLDPWSDPSGGAFQIIQALIALAAGDVFGRGLGLGNPALVPLAHSDFILTSIGEEFGLLGVVAVLVLHALLAARGLRIAWQAERAFDQLLAAGLSALTAFQTLLIVGGTVRALPLTGVTLPFVSYGGSSLLVQFIAIGLLLAISSHPRDGATGRRATDARRRLAPSSEPAGERSSEAAR